MVQYNSSMMQMMYCWGASRVCIIIRSENKRPMGPIAHLINNSHFSPDILILNTELLLKQVDFIVISHIEHCSSQEDLKTVVHKLTVIYIFSYVKTGPPPPSPPLPPCDPTLPLKITILKNLNLHNLRKLSPKLQLF